MAEYQELLDNYHATLDNNKVGLHWAPLSHHTTPPEPSPPPAVAEYQELLDNYHAQLWTITRWVCTEPPPPTTPHPLNPLPPAVAEYQELPDNYHATLDNNKVGLHWALLPHHHSPSTLSPLLTNYA